MAIRVTIYGKADGEQGAVMAAFAKAAREVTRLFSNQSAESASGNDLPLPYSCDVEAAGAKLKLSIMHSKSPAEKSEIDTSVLMAIPVGHENAIKGEDMAPRTYGRKWEEADEKGKRAMRMHVTMALKAITRKGLAHWTTPDGSPGTTFIYYRDTDEMAVTETAPSTPAPRKGRKGTAPEVSPEGTPEVQTAPEVSPEGTPEAA